MGRLATLCTAASSVEWYDFFLYATASAVVLGPAFFTPLGATGQVFASFTTFALAFVARPLGGILFGRIGDRAGRRAALAGSTIAMGIASVLVGLLPGYATIGVAAPVILVLLRLVQGLALGGQWAGSVLLLTERAPDGRRGLWGSVAQLGSPIGGIVSSGLFFLVAALMPADRFADWGWRIPFWVSILVVGLGLLVQRRIDEQAPAAPPRSPVLEVVRHRFGTVVLAAGLFVAASASLWVYVTYLLSYLPTELGTPRTTALLVLTVTQAFQIPGILGGAALSDRLGRRPVYLTAAIASLVWAFPAFLLIDHAGTGGLVLALAVAHLVLGAMYGPLAALYTELFAARVRYSGASLGYQLGTVLGGGLAPIIATALFAATGSSLAVAAYLVVVSVITVVAAVLVRGRAREALADDEAVPVPERSARLDGPGAARAPGDGGESAAPGDSGDASPAPDGAPGREQGGRRRSVRTRLVALIAVPTIVAVALGVVGVAGAVRSAAAYGRVAALADLAASVTTTAVALDDEQSTSAAFVASGRSPAARGAVTSAQRRVDLATADLRRLAAAVADDSATAASTRTRLDQALFRLDALPALRASTLTSAVPAGVVVTRYASVGADLLAVDDEVGQSGSDPEIGSSVRALGALSRARADLATERALLGAAYLAGGFEPGGAQALTDADAARTGDTARFRAAATESQAQTYDDVVAGAQVDQTEAVLAGVLRGGGATPGGAPAAQAWDAAASGTLGSLHTVESDLVTQIGDRARALRATQITTAVVAGLVALAVVIVVLVATILVVRSLTRPLRALRRGALQVADRRLPDLVTRLGRDDPERVDTTVEPIDVRSDDEIGEVAAAFDEVHREAVRLAAAESRRRQATGALVVNLSRRTQSLVERQIALIDDLESGEEDPQRLGDLFRLDHLATRMRRNGENLLVLGGEEPLRRWNRVMPLLDVLRAAASEVEQYERVEVRGVPEVFVVEDAVSDLVHLHAELVENATAFSSRTSTVRLGASVLADDTVLVEIADRGIGLGAEDLDALNARLAVAGDPADLGPDASRRMGIVVVARLAARLGVRVRLRRGEEGGLTAVVTLPSPLVTSSAPADGRTGRAPTPGGVPEGVPDGGSGWFGRSGGDPNSRGVSQPVAGVSPHDSGSFTTPRSTPRSTVGAPSDTDVPVERGAGFTPTADGLTADGLPRRRPGANQVAGDLSAPDATDPSSGPAPVGGAAWDRSPTAVRHRYAGVQQGRSRARVERTPPTGIPRPTPDTVREPSTGEPRRDVAEPVRAPRADGTTADGLPKRAPGANYVPGEASDVSGGPRLTPDDRGGPRPTSDTPAAWDRSADAIRARYSGFQHGRARARTENRHQEAT